MKRWLRIAGWVALGLVALWATLKIVGVIFSIVSWIVSAVVSILVLAGLLYLAYLAVTRLVGGKGGSGGTRSRSRDRERIFE